ncbi:hypothetical protein Ancab_035738 [Ancistrocladus abbreviatus]
MLPRNSIQKSKSFFHKAVLALKSFLFGRYRNLPKTLVLNPLSNCNNDLKSNHSDHIYPEFSIPWEPDHQENTQNVMKESIILPRMDDSNYYSGRSMKISDKATVKNKQEAQKNDGRRGEASSKYGNAGSYLLAQKMKELEMMDIGNVDHSLDVEEAIHYYSRLTCPIYLDIVDKFFMDMYTEFFIPQPLVSLNSSSRRLNSS